MPPNSRDTVRAGLHGRHAPSRMSEATPEVVGLSGEHRVTGAKLLPVGVDTIGVVDVVADESLEPRIAVEATAVLAELREPWPDRVGRRANGDRVIHAIARVVRPDRRRGAARRVPPPSFPIGDRVDGSPRQRSRTRTPRRRATTRFMKNRMRQRPDAGFLGNGDLPFRRRGDKAECDHEERDIQQRANHADAFGEDAQQDDGGSRSRRSVTASTSA